MTSRGIHTFKEISSQAQTWQKTIETFAEMKEKLLNTWRLIRPRQLIFIGCGSTYYLSVTAASIFQELTGIPSSAVPSSELFLYPDRLLTDSSGLLLVAISRSGTTSETLKAVDTYRRHGGNDVWAISCYPDSPLVEDADFALCAPEAQEQSLAQTRSFASMLLFAQLSAAAISGMDLHRVERLPAAAARLISESMTATAALAANLDLQRVYFLGSGHQFGIANEGMLKLTETSLTFSDAFYFMEYRHGPMSMVDEQALIIGLISKENQQHELKVMHEMKEKGAVTMTLNAAGSPWKADLDIQLADDFPPWLSPVLYLPPMQLFAYQRSLAKGLNPDFPRNLTAVITLDL